jgi:hypothetical protein
VGAADCPKAGVATTAASVNTKGKFFHCQSIAIPPFLIAFYCVPLEAPA